MASPVNSSYSVAAGQPIYGGQHRSGFPRGATLAAVEAAGWLGQNPSAFTKGAQLGALVAAGPLQGAPSWESGAAAGTLTGDLWTPARTGGVVNAASWALVPTGRWIEVANSAPSGIQAAIVAAIPDWASYTPNTFWDNWVGSWSGIVPEWGGTRFWIGGGGHSNGSNNMVARWDTYKMAYTIEAMPSSPSAWSTAYKAAAGSSSTGYPETAAAAAAELTAQTLLALNAVGFDETEETPPKPTARHWYEAGVHDPVRNVLWLTCRRRWKLDLSTGQWTDRRRLADSMEGWGATSADSSVNYLDGENIISFLDEATGIVTTTSNGSTYGGSGRCVKFQAGTGAWTGGTDAPDGPYGSGFAAGVGTHWQRLAQCSSRYGRKMFFVRAPMANTAGGSGGNDGWYGTLELDTGATTSSATDPAFGNGFQYAGGLTVNSFRPVDGDTDSQGLVALPGGLLWLTTWNSAAVTAIYEIDTTTAPWTIRPGPSTGAAPSFASKSARSMLYAAPIDAVVCRPSGTGNTRIYRRS